MLKVKDLLEIIRPKAEDTARAEREQETIKATSIPSVKHRIVPIPGK